MKRIFSSGDTDQVQLKRSVLEAAGIPCQIRDPYGVEGFFGASSPNAMFTEALWVEDKDYAEAQKLLGSSQE